MGGNMHSMDSPIFCVCSDIRTLGWVGDEKAKELLQRAANAVKPIMAKRKWKVAHLFEFYPPQPNLLGLNTNHGQRVQIRLRSPRDKSVFLNYESILHTLLHELCHNAIGPHNAAFYKLLDEVMKESENLGANGGFDTASGGQKLSTERRNPDLLDRRRLAAAAAEKRMQRRSIFKSGKLGGGEDGIHQICSPREMAVNAAMRRINDEKWCGSGVVGISVDDGAHLQESTAINGRAEDEVILLSNNDDDIVHVLDDDTPWEEREKSRKKDERRPERQIPIRNSAVAAAAVKRFGQQ